MSYEVAQGLVYSVVAVIAIFLWVCLWSEIGEWVNGWTGLDDLMVTLVGSFSPFLVAFAWAIIVFIRGPK